MSKSIAAALLLLLANLPANAQSPAHDEINKAVNAQQFARALTLTRPLAEAGDATAQAVLGQMYLHGAGVKRDRPEGTRWLQKAADQGLPAAIAELGSNFETGYGVPKDCVKGVGLLRNAADMGDSWAMDEYAYLLEFGRPCLPKDWDESLEFYRKAAQAGYVKAARNAAGLCERRHDIVQAVSWYRFAFERGGDSISAFFLGKLYAEGAEGLMPDPAEAYYLLSIAVRLNAYTPIAGDMADQLKPRLSAEQRAEIDTRVSRWQPPPTVPHIIHGFDYTGGNQKKRPRESFPISPAPAAGPARP